MKKLLFTLILLCVSSLHAEDAKFWIGPTLQWSSIAEQNTALVGLRVGYTPAPPLHVGICYSRVASSISHLNNNIPYSVSYAAFGVFAEPVIFSSRSIHLLVPVSINAGELDISSPGFLEKRSGGWFSGSDAGLFVEMNVTPQFRVAMGGGIRMTTGIESYGLSDKDFRTLFAGVSLKWGTNAPESP
jgi:hypothetical protein